MFKVTGVFVGLDGSMTVDVLDTEDGVVDTVSAYLIEAFLDFDISIQGVSVEDGEISFGSDVKVEYQQQEQYEDEDDLDEFYSDEEESENYQPDYPVDEDEDLEDFYSEDMEYDSYEEEDTYFDDEEDLDEYYEDVNKNNMYDYFSDESREILKNYYRWYTKNLYKDLANSIRLGISTTKAEQLANIRNRGTIWSFTGIYDSGGMGCSCCTLGHDIRYEFHAENEYGEDIIFGRECVKDFFNLDDVQLRNLTKTQDNMVNEIMEIAKKTISGNVGYGKEGLDFFLDVIYQLEENKELQKYLDKELIKHLENFINNEIALPKSMVKEVRRQLTRCISERGIYDIGMYANETSEILLKSLFGDTLGDISCSVRSFRCRDTFLKFLAYTFKNKIDGCYAHNPKTGVCKEEGSCRKQRRIAWGYNDTALVKNLGFKDIGMEELKLATKFYVYISDFVRSFDKLAPDVQKSIAVNKHLFSCEEFRQMEVEDENGVTQKIDDIINNNLKELDRVQYVKSECTSRYGKAPNIPKDVELFDRNIHELYMDLYELALDDYNARKGEKQKSIDSESVQQENQLSQKSNAGEVQNNRYDLNESMRNKCSFLLRAYSVDSIRMLLLQSKKDISVQIANTITKNGWYSDKQLRHIDGGIEFLSSEGITEDMLPSEDGSDLGIQNIKYVLEDNPDIRDMVERVYDSALDDEMRERIQRLNKIIYDIASKARRYGNISEKQLKYIRMGDMEIDKIQKEREGK